MLNFFFPQFRTASSRHTQLPPPRFRTCAGVALALLVFGVCRHSLTPLFALPAAAQNGKQSLSPMGALGRQIFFDSSLSASGRMSCATCHDPSHAYGPPNGLAVQLGGPGIDRQGARAVPSGVNRLAEASSPSLTMGEKELRSSVDCISLAMPSSL